MADRSGEGYFQPPGRDDTHPVMVGTALVIGVLGLWAALNGVVIWMRAVEEAECIREKVREAMEESDESRAQAPDLKIINRHIHNPKIRRKESAFAGDLLGNRVPGQLEQKKRALDAQKAARKVVLRPLGSLRIHHNPFRANEMARGVDLLGSSAMDQNEEKKRIEEAHAAARTARLRPAAATRVHNPGLRLTAVRPAPAHQAPPRRGTCRCRSC